MRINCVGFYKLTSNITTTLARICPWSTTPHTLEKSSHLHRARSSPSHKSAACIIGIVGPRDFGAAAGRHDNPLESIEDRLLQMASCSSLQTGHQLSAIQIATSKWKLASGQPTQAVFMHNTDFLLWTPPCC